MRTDLDAIVGYLAGRDGADAARLRADLGDPTSEASRFLESTRRRTRALLDDRPADLPVRLDPPRSRTGPIILRRSAVAATILGAVGLTLGLGEVRSRRLELALARGDAEARQQARRLEEALARVNVPVIPPRVDARPTTPVPTGADPTRLALVRVEEGLGKLERRLDGLARQEVGPGTAPNPPGPDPGVAELRAELAALRRESGLAEQATARQIQELRSVIQEVNLMIRNALSRPGGGQPRPGGCP